MGKKSMISVFSTLLSDSVKPIHLIQLSAPEELICEWRYISFDFRLASYKLSKYFLSNEMEVKILRRGRNVRTYKLSQIIYDRSHHKE